VPHRLIGEQLDARITAHMIELLRKGERVAVHLRGIGCGRIRQSPSNAEFPPALSRMDDRADRP
jgi:hypothetical protein